MGEIITIIQNNLIVLLIPLISAVVGWGTNVLAVRMMFYPTEFVGIPPYLGWQGIMPANAQVFVKRSTELITTRLLNVTILFENFKPEAFKPQLDPVLDDLTDQLIDEAVEKYAGPMWNALGDETQQQVRTMVRAEIDQATVSILTDIKDNIEDIIDLQKIVSEVIGQDKSLLSEMFQRVGAPEFRFIKISGLYFGFLFGVIQMLVWIVWPAWWILPFAGFMVGYLTNWVAIKLIFEPAEPKQIGPWTLQGLFHKRQLAVSEEFAGIVSAKVLDADNVVRFTVEGETGERLFAIVTKHIESVIARYENNPMVATMLNDDLKSEIRQEISVRMREEMSKPGGFLHVFAGNSVDIFGELSGRMSQLDSDEFEGVLRPAFQQDEWKLILAGAVLGLGAGVLQVVYIFGDMLAEQLAKQGIPLP